MAAAARHLVETALADASRFRSQLDSDAQAAAMAPGALRDFGRQPWKQIAGITGVSFVGEEDVGERGITRHGGAVARMVYLKVTVGGAPPYMLVYFTKEGLVTDFELAR